MGCHGVPVIVVLVRTLLFQRLAAVASDRRRRISRREASAEQFDAFSALYAP